jgi:putative mRNA 3-end processing factor
VKRARWSSDEPRVSPNFADIDARGRALKLRGTELSLDPPGRAPLGFVSHAGRAGSALPERAILTKATLELVLAKSPRAAQRSQPLLAAYGREFTLGELELALFPAGNVLGAAQLRCDLRGKRIVYAPDLGGVDESAPETAAPRAQLEADTLVLGARYGDPKFAFPPLQRALALVSQFVERAQSAGELPVVLAAPLGKSQEVARHLGREGRSVRLHPLAFRYLESYRSEGVQFANVAALDGPLAAGEVLIAPPGARLERVLLRPARTCLLSGAAQDPHAAEHASADEALPLSDHADHAQLVDYALASGARLVLTLGDGALPLAQALRSRGLFAEPLLGERQLPLPGLG